MLSRFEVKCQWRTFKFECFNFLMRPRMSRTQLWRIVLHALQVNCNSFLQNNLEELKHSNWNARHYRLTSNGSFFWTHCV